MTGYFVIYSGEDGMSIRGPMEAEEIEKRLEERYYGDVETLRVVPEQDGGCFMTGPAVLIIKGEIVVPETVDVVTKVRLR